MHTKEDCIEIGRRIKQARTYRDMTLSEVASAAGVAASTIQRYEVGAFTKIKMPVVQAIASALDVNPSWLALMSDDMFNDDEYSLDHIPGDALAQLRAIHGDDNEAIYYAWEQVLSGAEGEEKPTNQEADELSKAKQELIAKIMTLPEDKVKVLLSIAESIEHLYAEETPPAAQE